jgi:Trypsin-like peptidase domain
VTRSSLPRLIAGRAPRVATALAAVAVTLGAGGCGSLASHRSAAAPVTAPAAPPGVRLPAAGALFDGPADAPGAHHCSASVVDAPPGNVVLTAAHCVADGDGSPPRTGFTFIPGYHDGQSPFGAWTVTAAFVDDTWRASGDPDHDIAFVTVAKDGSPPVEQVTGAYHLDLDPGYTNAVDAVGYPDFADAPQVRSGTTARYSPTQLTLPAHGLYDGTSGGPWLRGPADTDVIGVTGGYEQGGLDPETSYATYPSAAAAALFRAAGGAP